MKFKKGDRVVLIDNDTRHRDSLYAVKDFLNRGGRPDTVYTVACTDHEEILSLAGMPGVWHSCRFVAAPAKALSTSWEPLTGVPGGSWRLPVDGGHLYYVNSRLAYIGHDGRVVFQ